MPPRTPVKHKHEKEKDKEKDVEHKREQESPVLKKANISLRSALVFFGFDLFIDRTLQNLLSMVRVFIAGL